MFSTEEPVLPSRPGSVSPASLVLILCLASGALTLLVASLRWEYSLDTPLLNYVGFLIWENDFVPYKDIFETSMPGTLAFHSLMAGLGLTGNLGFILAGMLVIIGFSVLGALIVLPLGRAGAVMAAPVITAIMLMMGPGWILKIDMVALVPISAALCLVVWPHLGPVRLRQLLIGFFFGVAGTMKPHLLLGAPVAVLAAYGIEHYAGRLRDLPLPALAGEIALSLVGFAMPLILAGSWLTYTGAHERFLFVLTEYLPLHLEKTDWQAFLPEGERRQVKLAATLRFGGHYPLVPLAALAPLLGLLLWRRLKPRQIIIIAMLSLLAALYGLAPALGGQFYVYYYFPFFFFGLLMVCAAISLIEMTPLPTLFKSLWIFAYGGFLILFVGQYYSRTLIDPPALRHVAEIEEALKVWVPEGGRVQPIDWTSGVVHGMLRQKVLPATPFLYDYHFHHHVGSETNTGMRAAFMQALTADPPEVFMEAREFPRVTGLNTSQTFPARDAFLAENYQLVAEERTFMVYLRNDLPVP